MRRPLLALVVSAWLWPSLAAASCEEWVASLVSAQGTVEVRREHETGWLPTPLGDRYCSGDSIRVQDRSRAGLRLRNEAVLRLDENTTITLTVVKDDWEVSLPAKNLGREILRGIVHFISRVPRGLKVVTPFVNGTVEGTEFTFSVTPDHAILTVFEGRVAAENSSGSLEVGSGQAAIARSGQAPTPLAVVRPRDAVQWALYYPSVMDYRPSDFPDVPGEDWPARVRRSLEAYRGNDLAAAFAALEGARPGRAPRFFTYRAVLLLSVGRVAEARADIAEALRLDARDGQALALQSLIATVQDEKTLALELGRKATEADPHSAAAWIALSYAEQASFDLQGARRSLEEAVRAEPGNGLAHSRLAEILLSFAEVGDATREAEAGARLSPDLARTQTVVGFAQLAQLRTEVAQAAFERAIVLDPADPLPRLGLGLTRIRRGDVAGGRGEIEIAAGLDPGNALVRSYLGKAYYEEKRDRVAGEEFGRAKTLDPNDPTPWFYDAIEKQSVNRPVEALHDLQHAIDLNDNRAVYRSRLLLDEDLAARSASLARIYDDLGFQKLALAEGWKSVNLDPTNFSAHRFLADSYSALPRHEIARVSELLQSQLLQPLNIDPVQPRLAASNLFILNSLGPSELSFNEFNPLFDRNRFAFQLSGLYGGNRTFGDEAVHSAVWQNFSYSLGQFHYETNGFRANDDLRQDIYNVFTQARLTSDTSVQLEYRRQQTRMGDLQLRFDPDNFSPDLRETERTWSIRGGFRHSLAPNSDVIGSLIYQEGTFGTKLGDFFDLETDEKGFTGELQHLFRGQRFSTIIGVGHFNADRTDQTTLPFGSETAKARLLHTNVYVYTLLYVVPSLTLTLGASGDFFSGGVRDRNQPNPKFGITWTPLPGTTVRGAAFRTFKRSLVTNQTIEPTQVAGFNQFFDDFEATDSWRYGIGVDQKLSGALYAGVEASWRRSDVPFTEVLPEGSVVRLADQKEELRRAYLYWAPMYWLALSSEYQYERLERPEFPIEGGTEVRTNRVPLAMAIFDRSGFRGRLQGTYVDQRGTFLDSTGEPRGGHDSFWVFDASIGYRLPHRWGLITIEARNLFDKRFRFQETDPVTPQLYPGRVILGRFTIAY